jgi:hypothetical protein
LEQGGGSGAAAAAAAATATTTTTTTAAAVANNSRSYTTAIKLLIHCSIAHCFTWCRFLLAQNSFDSSLMIYIYVSAKH